MVLPLCLTRLLDALLRAERLVECLGNRHPDAEQSHCNADVDPEPVAIAGRDAIASRDALTNCVSVAGRNAYPFRHSDRRSHWHLFASRVPVAVPARHDPPAS